MGITDVASMAESTQKFNCRIGIVADVQYADRPPKPWTYTKKGQLCYDHSKTRDYRKSFDKFKEYADNSKTRRKLDAFVHLGDLIDSSSRFNHNEDSSENEMDKVIQQLDTILTVMDSFNTGIKLN